MTRKSAERMDTNPSVQQSSSSVYVSLMKQSGFLKAGEFAGSVNAFLSGFGRAVDTDDLEVVLSLVEVQLTVNISVLDVRPVEPASMTNVLQKVDLHDANVAVADNLARERCRQVGRIVASGSACGVRERDVSRARPAGAVAADGFLPADYGMRATLRSWRACVYGLDDTVSL